MSDIEIAVSGHYSSTGLLGKILAGLKAAGVDPGKVQADDLAPVDELHIGGRAATEYAVSKLSLTKNDHVLDVGCGLGGAARYIATSFGCPVTGIDLTPDFITTAQALTQMTGLEGRVDFHLASALEMPFKAEAFDAAITIHVAMNIPDRAGLYAEIARVMKPGASLCIYDVMKMGDQPITFPVPWSEAPNTSHLVSSDEMRDLLEAAGFTVDLSDDRTEFAVGYFRKAFAAMKHGPAPLGPHMIMGATAREKLTNLSENLASGRIAPVVMIARRKG